jgi:S1-C subfamily serine protease
MNPRSYFLLLFVTAPLFLAGCLQGTLRERNASFSHYKDTKIRQETTKDFLTSRTAFLLTGDRLSFTQSGTNQENFNYHAASGKLDYGSATAIDRRGYFLTAAHCVGKEAPYLVFGPGSHLQAERASVVWRGDTSKGEPDLAVLYVPSAINEVFEWASDCKAGDRVFAVGPNYEQRFNFKVVCIAGAIANRSANSEANVPLSISHTAPLHKGDSGGPLADANGQLIGINVRGMRTFSILHPLGKRLGYAKRPDVAWLKQVIDGHAASH